MHSVGFKRLKILSGGLRILCGGNLSFQILYSFYHVNNQILKFFRVIIYNAE